MAHNEMPRGKHAAGNNGTRNEDVAKSASSQDNFDFDLDSFKGFQEVQSHNLSDKTNRNCENPFADQELIFNDEIEIDHSLISASNHCKNGRYEAQNNPFAHQNIFFEDDKNSDSFKSSTADSFDFGDFAFDDMDSDNSVKCALANGGNAHHRTHVSHRADEAKRKNSKAKSILLGIFIAVLVLVGAGVGYAAWYGKSLNNALAPDEEELNAINDATTEVQEGDAFYTLLMVSDSREGTNGVDSSEDSERSDVILLLRVDPTNRVLTMVSVPRDTPYTFPDGSVNKLNETYNQGGAAMTIQAVEEITGVKISHYAEMNFSDVEAMVNDLGGIEVNVDTPISGTDSYSGESVTLDAGTQTLDGAQAKVYLQTRKVYEDDQDMHRQQNVRNFVQAVVSKVLSQPLNEIPGTILDLAQYISTDMTVNDLVELAQEFAGGNITVYSCTGPDKGEINEDAGGIWLCYDNPDGWKRLMQVVDAGEDPSNVDVNAE